ncbi:MAG: glycosyltransferase family 39 protein [Alphaproteobacteria bacterium]|nr:glycosyltransferase family 39 protein [Alphaproteobacteria bacterium]
MTDVPKRWLAIAILCWAAIVVAGLALRPAMPVDETRYLGVAYEMWQRGDLLVPHRNDVAYHHKPPLLFWAMQAGWAVFGVGELWARLVAPLFALGSLVLTACLARGLFADRPAVAAMAPLLLIASALFAVFASLTFFDTLVTFFALLGWIGVVDAWRGSTRRGWLLVALSIGLGILAKGPVQLLHVLPPALLAPLWMTRARPQSWRRWYGGLALAVLGGAAVALAWAIPAAIAGGEAFARKIFLGQHTGRIVEAFAHKRPFWWYVPVLAGLLVPIVGWITPWRRLRGAAAALRDEPGLRFLAATFVPVLVAFSAISGKQPQYMLPEFALVALAVARLAAREDLGDRRRDRMLPAFGLVALGIAMLALPLIGGRFTGDRPGLDMPSWFGAACALAGFVLIGYAGWFLRDPPRAAVGRAATLAIGTALALVAVNVGFRLLAPAYDTRAAAAVLAQIEAQGRPIAVTGDYENEFRLTGRLRSRVADELSDQDLIGWARANPQGVVIVDNYRRVPALPAGWPVPLHLGAFRGRVLAIWPASEIAGPRGAELLRGPPAP